MIDNPPDWETLYRDTIYAISHDLGTQFRHLKSFSQYLIEENPGLDSESLKWLSYINNAGQESQAMLEGLTQLSRIFTNQSRLSVIGAEELASCLGCKILGPLNDAHICGNIEDLARAFDELVNNAINYSEFLERRLSRNGETLLLTAIARGKGITDEEWPLAQRPFTRLNARRCAAHVGMGLPIAAALIGQMKGGLINTDNGVALQLPLV